MCSSTPYARAALLRRFRGGLQNERLSPMRVITFAMSTMLTLSLSALPSMAGGPKAKHWRAENFERDCVPLDGFYGYYGNPWCDTGSYRLEDIWFRERQAQLHRWKAVK
jgi:hypothetical protein